jgi:hypothetical protein
MYKLKIFIRPVPLIDLPNVAYHHDSKSITQFFYDRYAQLDKESFV